MHGSSREAKKPDQRGRAKTAKNLWYAGLSLTVIGVVMNAAGGGVLGYGLSGSSSDNSRNSKMTKGGIALLAVGGTVLLVGVVLWITGAVIEPAKEKEQTIRMPQPWDPRVDRQITRSAMFGVPEATVLWNWQLRF